MYKLISDNIVIDVIEEPIWVTCNAISRCIVSTIRIFAKGIVSSDRSGIFHIEGKPKEGFEDCTTVSIVEITEEEALELQAILEANEQELIEQLQEELGVEEVPEEQILPRAPLMELQARVEQLTRRLEALEEENQRLREQE
jgi:hypothetical protein